MPLVGRLPSSTIVGPNHFQLPLGGGGALAEMVVILQQGVLTLFDEGHEAQSNGRGGAYRLFV